MTTIKRGQHRCRVPHQRLVISGVNGSSPIPQSISVTSKAQVKISTVDAISEIFKKLDTVQEKVIVPRHHLVMCTTTNHHESFSHSFLMHDFRQPEIRRKVLSLVYIDIGSKPRNFLPIRVVDALAENK